MPGDCAPGLVITANTQLRLISLFPLSHIQPFRLTCLQFRQCPPLVFFSFPLLKIYIVPGKTPRRCLLIIESDFNASAQFANLFVAVTIESTF